jgi:Domain of unknown function (DUF4349)/Putative zinc-finger
MSRTTQHEFAPEEVMAYLDGELAPTRAAALATHLQRCDECGTVAAQLQQLSERLLDFSVEVVHASASAAIAAALEETHIEKPTRAGKVELSKPRSWTLGFASPYTWVLVGLVILAFVGRFGFPNLPRFDDEIRSAAPSSSLKYQSRFAPTDTVPAAKGEMPKFTWNQIARAGGGGDSADGGGTAAGALEAPETAGPMIAQTVSFTILAANYDEASAAVDRLAGSHGGYVQKLSAQAQAGAARELSATLRVPATQLGDTMAQIRKLGRVEQETRENEEVTDQYVDLQARLKSARATEQRLLQLLATRTGKLEDVLAVEQELARIREEIESMDGQRTVLLHRVNYVTVDVSLREDYHEQIGSPAATGTGLRNALVEGVSNFEDGAVSLLVFMLAYGPSILFWCALILVPAFFIWRRLRARADN